MGIRVLAFGLSLSILFFVLELVRREALSFKYAFIWLTVCVLGLLCAIFSDWLFALSRLFGFEVPSNFIFFGLFGIFVFVSLLLTVFLCHQNRRNDRMAQKIGMLELEIRRLVERMDRK
ncbi:MAG: DUF2304 domain-containing protein [Candidatus Omnitrophica bacterium]|nr:DUF2304 domain-containing protein [Candidatus Omnitrophota bacterium]